MVERTKAALASDLSTGGSSDGSVETKFLVDLLDSFVHNDDAVVSGVILPTYTVATVPVDQAAGTIIFLSDGTGPIAVFDGADWLYADGTTVGV